MRRSTARTSGANWFSRPDTPHGGLATTVRPYHGGAEKVLDYIFVSRGMSRASCVCDSLEVVLPTDHKPLTALLRRAPLQGIGRRRSRYIRRKWKGWSEACPGQVAALIKHGGWTTVEQAEQNIARAGASSARRAAQGSWAPFDDCISQIGGSANYDDMQATQRTAHAMCLCSAPLPTQVEIRQRHSKGLGKA